MTLRHLPLIKSILALTFISSGLLAQSPVSSSPVASPPPGAAVLVDGSEVFRIQASVGSFSPQARAEAISERVSDLERNPFSKLPPLQVTDDGVNANVMVGDVVLFSTTPEDARLAGEDRVALAHQRADRVSSVLASHTWVNRAKSMGISIGLVLLITLVGWLAYRLLRWGFAKVETRAVTLSGQRLQPFLARRLHWLPLANLEKTVNILFTGARAVAYSAMGYVYLSAVFSQFPWTKGLAGRLFAFAWGPISTVGMAVLGYLPKLFFLLLILLAARYLLKLISLAFGAIKDEKLSFRGFHPEWAEPTYKLVRFLVLAFTLVVAFPYLPGAQSEAFKGVSLFVGVLISLGSSGAVGNMVAGVLITYMRPFRIGDRIQVGDTLGDVIERTALVTRVRTIKNVDVTIPNSTILSSQVHNFSANSKDKGLILHTTVTIGYDAPWATVHALLIDAALATEGVLKEPKPFVLQTSLDDFYVSYQINAFTNQAGQMAGIYSALHANIQDKFNEGGVEILSPHYAQLRDGNMVTIPLSYLPKDYAASTFRIEQVPPEKGD